MSSKRALITGITGQDGAYLSQLLLQKGYEVHGAVRPDTAHELTLLRRLDVADDVQLIGTDLSETDDVVRLVRELQPDEIYNLAAQSFVATSWANAIEVADINALGVTRLLDAVHTYSPHSRFYQASTAEMFGDAAESPQNETTSLSPRSPYGAAKAYAHFMTSTYRHSFGLHASAGILFNHESPLRAERFVTRKISAGLVRIRNGASGPVELGNLAAKRDWGFAGDYVDGMWRMVQQDAADDYVLATGETTSIREFATFAALALDFEPEWHGSGIDETCIDARTGTVLIAVNPEFFRPIDVAALCGDATKARTVLGWDSPIKARELAAMMVAADRELLA